MMSRLRIPIALSVMLLGAPAISFAQARPTISIAPFDTDRTGWMPPPHFGETIADMLANRLVDLGAFRVFDRGLLPGADRPGSRPSFDALRELASQAGVDYVVMGAVTKFSNEKTSKRGGVLGVPFLGGVGKNTQESAIGLTIRVINVKTGEIITSTGAQGSASKQNHTVTGGGLVHALPVGAMYTSGSAGSLDRLLGQAIGEAVESAATALTRAAPKMIGG